MTVHVPHFKKELGLNSVCFISSNCFNLLSLRRSQEAAPSWGGSSAQQWFETLFCFSYSDSPLPLSHGFQQSCIFLGRGTEPQFGDVVHLWSHNKLLTTPRIHHCLPVLTLSLHSGGSGPDVSRALHPQLPRAALPVLGRGQGQPGGWDIFWLSVLGLLF